MDYFNSKKDPIGFWETNGFVNALKLWIQYVKPQMLNWFPIKKQEADSYPRLPEQLRLLRMREHPD